VYDVSPYRKKERKIKERRKPRSGTPCCQYT
jgi:hypothetical protein